MVVVVGSSRGIGFELVKKLLASGETVIACSRSLDTLKDLQKTYSKLLTVQLDISSPDSWLELFNTVPNQGGRVDKLVINAGTLINAPFNQVSEEQLIQVYRTNVIGPHLLIGKLSPYYTSGTHVLTIGSVGGVTGSLKFSGLSAYSPTKGALSILTEVLAEELKSVDVRVNCLALGSAQTEMLSEAFPGYQAPLSASEMADFVFWFVQNGAKYFNGKTLPVALTNP